MQLAFLAGSVVNMSQSAHLDCQAGCLHCQERSHKSREVVPAGGDGSMAEDPPAEGDAAADGAQASEQGPASKED